MPEEFSGLRSIPLASKSSLEMYGDDQLQSGSPVHHGQNLSRWHERRLSPLALRERL
jgi:hypothetical protein